MKKGNLSARIPFVTLLMPSIGALLISGCYTLVGLTAGTAIDKASKGDIPVTDEELRAGTRLIVTMKDSSVVKGTFVGTAMTSPDRYQAIYDSIREAVADTVYLPVLNEKVTVCDTNGNVCSGTLAGFDMLGDGATTIIVSRPLEEYPFVINMALLRTIYSRPPLATDAATVVRLVRDGKIPIRTRFIVVERNNTRLSLDRRNIVKLAIHNAHHYWLVGAAIGLAVDTILVASAVYLVKTKGVVSFR